MGVPSDIEEILAELDNAKPEVDDDTPLRPTCRQCAFVLVDESINVTEVYDECREYGSQYATEDGSLSDIDYDDHEITGRLVKTIYECPNCGKGSDSWDVGPKSLMMLRPVPEEG